MSGQRRLLFFVVKVFILVLIFSSFWPFVAPGYTSLLVATSNPLAPSTITMTADHSSIIFHSAGQEASLGTLPFQAGLILLLALIIATPGLKVRQRLKFIVAAAIVMFVIHVASVRIMCSYGLAMRPLVVLFASVGIDLFPLLIWIALSAKYWWPRRGALLPARMAPQALQQKQTVVTVLSPPSALPSATTPLEKSSLDRVRSPARCSLRCEVLIRLVRSSAGVPQKGTRYCFKQVGRSLRCLLQWKPAE